MIFTLFRGVYGGVAESLSEVEGVSFRVPRAPLELGSTTFLTTYHSQTPSQSSSLAASKDAWTAIRLEDVTKSEFRAFLRVIYPNM